MVVFFGAVGFGGLGAGCRWCVRVELVSLGVVMQILVVGLRFSGCWFVC